ncbi:hypothetical protein IJT93_12165 [bacterium]|nr:hypothetical protein [bacterium]
MSSKKNKKNKSENISLAKTNGAAAAKDTDAPPPRTLIIMGFGFLGLLMGFLWGANSIIDVGHSPSALIQAAKVGAAVATNTADWDKGLIFGFVGTVIGGSFGYSIFLQPKLMFFSWLFGFIGLAAGSFLGHPAFCGIGWLIGYGAVIFYAAKKHFPQAYAQISKSRS